MIPGVIEANEFTQICFILEANIGEDSLLIITKLLL